MVNTLPCDDSNACTAADSCSNGVCTGGTKLACDDGNPCTSDSCGTGACSHLPNTLPCNDQSACTYGEACIQGVCGGGLVSACADANPCTTDSCDPASGCKHSASTGVPCADGNLCTTGDSCTSAGQCTGAGTFTCTDGNPCTFDSCVVNVGCNYAPNSNPCSDGDACTSGDTCGTGQCTGTATNCEDSNPCTEDACAKTTGCLHIANAKPCDDGTVCTGPDACKDGNCGGVAVICDDANPCTTDACASTSGCSHAAVAANTKCGDIGVCLSGKCSPGSDVNPATSCLAIKQALPTAASGVYWLDPDQKGAGDKYQVFCEMVQYGGGWLRIDNNWANTLLVMTNPFLSSGLCKMTASELRAWDGFAGAPGYGHLCIATRPQGNFMAYSELRIEGVVLVGYTPGKGNTYDLTGDCYGFKHTGAVCAGPNDAQHPVYPSFKSVGNGEKMGPSTFAIALGKVYSDFQIRAREEGPQLEGIVWNSGAFWLR